jgi:hypothetical protein
LVSAVPFTTFTEHSSVFVDNGFEFINGLFVPILSGNQAHSTSTFATMFKKAYENKDIETLKTFIYPYRVNAMHYFALTGKNEALQYCIDNGV